MSDKLQAEVQFYDVEFHLFRAGAPALLKLGIQDVTHKLDAAGGIGPYEFYCRPGDGSVTPHTIVGQEL